jgi:hypothetical protein
LWPRPCENRKPALGRDGAFRVRYGLIRRNRPPGHLADAHRLPVGAIGGADAASRPHRIQQSAHSCDHHHAFHVVGEHVQRHLSGHLGQLFREKVRCSHPTLDRAEWMLRCLTTDTHGIGIVVQPILNFLQNGLVLPA